MNDIVWFTSISRSLYENKIYGKCLDSWHLIPQRKILFSEGKLSLPGFETIDLDHMIDTTGFFKKKRKTVVNRFYRKALSIYWALKHVDARYVVWLDSDIEVLKALDVFPTFEYSYATIFYPWNNESLANPDVFYSNGVDTGIMIFDKEKIDENFAEEYINYWHEEKILQLEKEKDTYVISDMAKKYTPSNLMKEYLILPSASNYFDYTDFKDYLFHYIGRHNK
jgi:hypothetical protein